MNKKLLVVTGVLGAAAVTLYIFRDRLVAGALELGGKLNQIQEDLGWTMDDEDHEDLYVSKEGNE